MAKHWFRRRRGLFSKDLGWGWMPISWEGWMAIIASLAIVILAFFLIGVSNRDYIRGFLFLFTVIIVILLSGAISEWKTERD